MAQPDLHPNTATPAPTRPDAHRCAPTPQQPCSRRPYWTHSHTCLKPSRGSGPTNTINVSTVSPLVQQDHHSTVTSTLMPVRSSVYPTSPAAAPLAARPLPCSRATCHVPRAAPHNSSIAPPRAAASTAERTATPLLNPRRCPRIPCYPCHRRARNCVLCVQAPSGPVGPFWAPGHTTVFGRLLKSRMSAM